MADKDFLEKMHDATDELLNKAGERKEAQRSEAQAIYEGYRRAYAEFREAIREAYREGKQKAIASCDALSCVYNKKGACSRGHIHITLANQGFPECVDIVTENGIEEAKEN